MVEFNCSDIIDLNELGDENDLIKVVSWVCLVLGVVLMIIFYLYFLLMRTKYDRLRKRNIFLFSVYYLGLVLTIVNYSLVVIIGRKNYSCDVYNHLDQVLQQFLIIVNSQK